MHRVLLVLLAASAAAYSLNRVPKRDGYACIPVPIDKLVAPGQRATMHVYDASSIQAIRHAQAHANSTYGQVVIDEDAMAERRFALKEYGSRVRLVSVAPSTHTDKFGGSSASLMAQVIGVGVIQPQRVLEKMPFMTVECEVDDALLLPSELPDDVDALHAALSEAAARCESLDAVCSFKGDLTRATEMELTGGEREAWTSIAARVEQVLEYRACDDACEAARLTLSALAATEHLPGSWRFDAMKLAQDGDAAALLKVIGEALDEEARRRLAQKALSDLSLNP